jgi:hypothetical protein
LPIYIRALIGQDFEPSHLQPSAVSTIMLECRTYYAIYAFLAASLTRIIEITGQGRG